MNRKTAPRLASLSFVLISSIVVAACVTEDNPRGGDTPAPGVTPGGGVTAPTGGEVSATGGMAPVGTPTGATGAGGTEPGVTGSGETTGAPGSGDTGSGAAGATGPDSEVGGSTSGAGGTGEPTTNSMGGSASTDPTASMTGTDTVGGSDDMTDGGSTMTLAEGGYPEFPGAGCDAAPGEYGAVDNPNLPNPFQMHDGSIISTKAEWECRRAQIIHDLEEFEVGPKPPPPEVAASLNGNTLSVVVTTDAGSITLTSNISGSGPCVAIGVDGPSSMISGCTNVPFSANQVARQGTTGDAFQSDGYYQVYPELWVPAGDGNAAVGNYSAWSWGVSRLIDGLEQVKDELGIDMTKIGIHGCSWAGKLALWAGALDARIALTVAQESGGGGAASWRISEDYEDATGSSVEDLDNTGWSWFIDWLVEPYIESGGGGKNPHLLPHDHHELVALIAPRALILLPGDPGNTHLAPHSAYASFQAAKQVWKALGVEDHAGVVGHNQGGAHCQASQSQSQATNAFVDRFLKDGSSATQFNSGVDYNWESYVDWDTPTLQ